MFSEALRSQEDHTAKSWPSTCSGDGRPTVRPCKQLYECQRSCEVTGVPWEPCRGRQRLFAPLQTQNTEAQEGRRGLSKVAWGSFWQLRPEPRLPGSEPRAVPASDGVGVGEGWRKGQSWHTEGLRRAGRRCVQSSWAATRGGLAGAAAGAGVGEDVVVTPVLQLAAGLSPSVALWVQELAALLLLSPQPANKHSTDLSYELVTQRWQAVRCPRHAWASTATKEPSARTFPGLGKHDHQGARMLCSGARRAWGHRSKPGSGVLR